MSRVALWRDRTVRARRVPPPALVIDEGTLQGLKWLALGLMVIDHANKYLASGQIAWMFAVGRVSLPLFCFVLAYNLNRPRMLDHGGFTRVLQRTALSGAVATPFFMLLGGLGWGWWPLNILFTLFVATAISYLLERRHRGDGAWAIVAFVIGGAVVEFWWVGLGLCLAARYHCKHPGVASLVGLAAATAALYVVNRNLWALAALPLIVAAPHLHDLRLPRWRMVFYVVYPAHLALLLGVRWGWGIAG